MGRIPWRRATATACCSEIDPGRPGRPGLSCWIAGEKGGEPTHIVILLERVVEKHTVNLQEVARRHRLSLREVEVVGLVCEGRTNREIGEKLFIGVHTVKDHLKNIMRKMQVATRNEIVTVLI